MVVATIVYQLSDWRDNKIFDSDKNGGCFQVYFVSDVSLFQF